MKKQLLLAILLLALSVVSASAQGSLEQAAKNARDQFFDIKNRSIELERMKREANKRPASANSAHGFPEIKEDFEQIQKINSDFLQPTIIKTPVDYAAVLKSVSEVNRRAVRLKANLFSAEPKQKKDAKTKRQIADEQQKIEILLNILDKSIGSFVHSSIFQNTNLVNSQDSFKAQNDLERIIKVSQLIKEQAGKITGDSEN
ncbi:MAG: hypothetical protein M3525_02195 [Acidobacteriota bacterium]|nr:hypothetical protein [Acidobacteriota bacterium]